MKFLMQVVCCLAFVFFNNQSTSASPQNGSDQIYLIQLAASSDPDLKKFNNVKRYGYVYTSTTNTGIQKILLGSYKSKSSAKSVLTKVKAKGYKDAFITSQPLDPNGKVFSVQFISYAYSTKIDWEKFQMMGDVRIDPSAGKIKLMRGTFYDQESARSYAKTIESEGYKGAFIRELNEGVLLWPDNNHFVSTGTLASTTTTGTGTATTSSSVTTATTGNDGFADPYKSSIYTSLSTFEKEQVVYLDGVLSIKQNGKFIQLKNYVPGTLTGTISSPTNASSTTTTTTRPIAPTPTATPTTPSVSQIEPVSTPTMIDDHVVLKSTPSEAVAAQEVAVVEQPISTQPAIAMNNGMTAKGGDLAAATYKIQLTAVTIFDPLKFSNIDHLGTVDMENSEAGVKRIMLGTFVTKEDAAQALNQIKEKGFQKAYIVEYNNGTRR